jgi:tetratricopeptide (TPR) repeat protein
MAVLIVALSGCGASQSNDISALMKSGKDAADSHKLADCIEAYTAVLKVRSDVVAAYVGRAGCLLGQGNAGGAIQDYTQAIRLSPGDPDLYLKRADAEVAVGNKTAASSDYRKISDLASANGGQFAQAAESLAGIAFYPDALFVLNSGLTVYGNAWYLHKDRGLVEVALGNDDTAMQEFQLAISLSSGVHRAEVLGNRANLHLARARYALAIQDYTQAIKLDSEQYWFYRGRAEASQALGDSQHATSDFTSAIRMYQSLPTRDPDILADLFIERGKLYLAQGVRPAALADFYEALKTNRSSNQGQRAVIEKLIAAAQAT